MRVQLFSLAVVFSTSLGLGALGDQVQTSELQHLRATTLKVPNFNFNFSTRQQNAKGGTCANEGIHFG